jgi:hypothetical protein
VQPRHTKAGACFVFLLGIMACGGAFPVEGSASTTHATLPAKTPKSRTYEISDKDIDEIVREVSVARQLSPTRPVAVERLDPKRFKAKLAHGPSARDDEEGLTADAAFLLGFDFLPEPDKRAQVASTEDVLKEQVAGFYDHSLDRIFVPSVTLRTEDDLLEQRGVLAHEIQHALQAQCLPAFKKDSSHETSDEWLAHLALLEGDAMVAMGSALGAEAGAPVGRTLRRIVEATKRVPLATVTRGEEHASNLDRALDVTRQRLLFPYREGMLFVSDVYRAGGFPLVDKIYSAPPTSTAQILHPQKYLGNEQPRRIADPKPPPGYSKAVVDTLGELDTKILLSRCLDATVAETAASGWAGSRFGVFVGPDRHLAVAWVSAWDTEQDARELEAALRQSEACWHDNALGLRAGDYVIDAQFRVERRGDIVAFLRGYGGAGQAAQLSRLFSLVGPKTRSQPLTDLKIPPRVPLPEPKPGRLEGDVYENEWLGITGRVAPGMRATAGGKNVDLIVERSDVLIRGGLAYSQRLANDEQNERTFHEVEEAFAEEAAKLGQQAEVIRGGRVDTALGSGVERTWRVAGTPVEERVVLIPICAGTGSIAFLQIYGDPYARSVLDAWLGSFRWLHGRNLVACDYLDPK